MSFSDIVRIQGDLQANPPSYTLVEEALKNLQYNYVKQKRAEIEAAVREALLRWTVSKDSQEDKIDESGVTFDEIVVIKTISPIMVELVVSTMEAVVEDLVVSPLKPVEMEAVV